MNIKSIELNKLNPASYNPRTIAKSEMDKLKKGLQEFGLVDPLVINSDMTVIGGHQRLKAMQALKWDVCECVVLDLSKDKEKALNIALNRIGGEFDNDALAKLVQGLASTVDFDFSLTGLDGPEMDALFNFSVILPASDEDFDTEAKLDSNGTAKTKPGDIWLLDRHRLMCGDSTHAPSVAVLLNGKKSDMIFTDPPYGVDYASKNAMLNKHQKGNRIQTDIQNDALGISEQQKLWVGAFTNMFQHLRGGGHGIYAVLKGASSCIA